MKIFRRIRLIVQLEVVEVAVPPNRQCDTPEVLPVSSKPLVIAGREKLTAYHARAAR